LRTLSTAPEHPPQAIEMLNLYLCVEPVDSAGTGRVSGAGTEAEVESAIVMTGKDVYYGWR
jgi:hypothetical protein